MKTILYLFAIMAILSCNNNPTISKVEKGRIMDPILENWLHKFPNYDSNALVREKAIVALDKLIDSAVTLNYLNDIPLKVFKIGLNPHGKGAIVQFHTDNFDRMHSKLLTDRLNFDIIGFIDEDKASTLIEDKTYTVTMSNLHRLKENDVYVIVPRTYYSAFTEIKKEINSEVFLFNIGCIAAEVDSFKNIN